MKSYQLTERVPRTQIERDDGGCMPEWVYEHEGDPPDRRMLSPAQSHHVLPLFRWRRMVLKLDLAAPVTLVALVLAEHCNADDLVCWPSEAALVAETGLCKRTVVAAVAELDHRGLVIVQRRSKGNRRNDTNVYAPAWPAHYVWRAEIEVLAGALEIASPCAETDRPGAPGAPRGAGGAPSSAPGAPHQVQEVPGEGVTEGVTEGVSQGRNAAHCAIEGASLESEGQERPHDHQSASALHTRPQGHCTVCGTPFSRVTDRGQLAASCGCSA